MKEVTSWIMVFVFSLSTLLATGCGSIMTKKVKIRIKAKAKPPTSEEVTRTALKKHGRAIRAAVKAVKAAKDKKSKAKAMAQLRRHLPPKLVAQVSTILSKMSAKKAQRGLAKFGLDRPIKVKLRFKRTPFYKKGWFWTVVGASATALGFGIAAAVGAFDRTYTIR